MTASGKILLTASALVLLGVLLGYSIKKPTPMDAELFHVTVLSVVEQSRLHQENLQLRALVHHLLEEDAKRKEKDRNKM